MKKLAIALLVLSSQISLASDLTIYSSRKEHLIKPLIDNFQKETGKKISLVTDKAGVLIQRIMAEGESTPADLLMTVDAGNLWFGAKKDIFQKVESDVLKKNIPGHLKDPDNKWHGLSLRARTIVYSTKRVKPSDLSTYENLGQEKWKKRVCLRTSKKVYNQSLVAMFLAEHGSKKTEKIVKSWVNNLAAPVFSNDTKVIEAILAGQCDVGIVNSYYFGRLQKKNPKIAAALFWPNQKSTGVHVNISGAGVLKNAKNKKTAIQFLEWLSLPKNQILFSELNLEFPASQNVAPTSLVKSWGSFKSSEMNLSKAGEYQSQAIQLMDRAGYK